MARILAVELEQINSKDRDDIDRREAHFATPAVHQRKRLPMFLRYIVDTAFNPGGQRSSRAAGRSGPKVFPNRLLALAPLNVPSTAPIIPATKPVIARLAESPIAMPHSALITSLMMT